MQVLFITVILFIFIVWVIQAVLLSLSQKSFGVTSVLNYIASACLIIGITGFLAPALLIVSKIEFSESFEWPVGNTRSALQHSSGIYIVPHEPSGRVQLYDNSLKFLRGWQIEANGGSFNLNISDDNSFYIYTARGDMKYHFDLQGKLLSSEKHLERYPNNRSHLLDVAIPTPAYLWVFTNPFKAWIVAVLGIILANIANRLSKSKRRQQIG